MRDGIKSIAMVMSRYGATKERILKLVAQGNNNLSKISRELELSPSTVSKHLHDLEEEGRIERQNNAHFKKWKFYAVGTPNKQEANSENYVERIGRGRMIAIAAFLLLSIAAAAYVYGISGKVTQIPIRITDPPEVPAGTQALYINYSSLEAEVNNGGKFTWIALNSSGRIDLMGLINYTQLIGELNTKSGEKINRVAFNITSASITIDNITYAVHLLSKQVTASVENGNVLNSTSGILLDMSPIVTPEYAQNSTTFTMLPFLRAAVAPEPNKDDAHMNNGFQAPYPLEPYYRGMFSSSSQNLTVTNLTLSSDGNETALNITIRNTGKSNIGIMGIVVPYDGAQRFFSNNHSAIQGTRNILQRNCSIYMNGSEVQMTVRWCMQSDSSVVVNESAVGEILPYLGNAPLNVNFSSPVRNLVISDQNAQPDSDHGYVGGQDMNAQAQQDAEFMLAHPPALNFFVSSEGILSLPAPRIGTHASATEYTLNADSSATLTFKGRLMENIGTLSNNTHNISIITDRGIAKENVTAG